VNHFVRRVLVVTAAAVLGSVLAPSSSAVRPGREEARGRAFGYLSRDPLSRQARARLRTEPSTARRVPAAPSRGSLAPVNELGFDGIQGHGNIWPSDTVGAAGPDHVVTAVNVEFAIYDEVGNPLLGPRRLRRLFPNLPSRTILFDPKVVYDHYRGRFVLAVLAAHGPPFGPGEKRSWILMVSIPQATATQTGTWCKRSINGDQRRGDGRQFADYPGLGFDKQRVYVTTNQFTFDREENFDYAQILALHKGRLYHCNRSLAKKVFAGGQTRDPEGTPAFTIQPAVTLTETGAAPPEYMVSFQDTSFCRGRGPCGKRLTIWRINRGGGELRLFKRSVGVGVASIAPYGTQRGGSFNFETLWDTGDLRLINAVFDADLGRLYTAHAVRADLEPDIGGNYIESAIRWYEVDPSPFGDIEVTRKAFRGTPETDAGWPVLATDATGTLFLTYSRASAFSSPPEYLSAWAATVQPATIGFDQLELVPGEARHEALPGPERWGDYNGISRDPDDPTQIWMVNQIAESDGSGPSSRWQQTVNRVSDA
jgi:hypothetical protein